MHSFFDKLTKILNSQSGIQNNSFVTWEFMESERTYDSIPLMFPKIVEKLIIKLFPSQQKFTNFDRILF